MMKINNDAEWEEVKKGTYKGFSIEGMFQGFEQLQSKQLTNEEIVEQIKELLKNH